MKTFLLTKYFSQTNHKMARTKAVKRQVNHKHRCKASKKTDEKEEEESQQRDTQQLETVAKISITSPSGRKVCQTCNILS